MRKKVFNLLSIYITINVSFSKYKSVGKRYLLNFQYIYTQYVLTIYVNYLFLYYILFLFLQ